MASSEEENNDDEDDDDVILAKWRKTSNSSELSSGSSEEEYEEDGEEDTVLAKWRTSNLSKLSSTEKAEKIKQISVLLRFLLSKNGEPGSAAFERAKIRQLLFYSPYTSRRFQACSSASLFQSNLVRLPIHPGKRYLLMHKFRRCMLDNRWIEVVSTAGEFLKFPYSVLSSGTQTLCNVLMKPLLLSLYQPSITPQNSDKLQKIFGALAMLPWARPKRLQLELAHLLVAANQNNDVVITTLRRPLRHGFSLFRGKEPDLDSEIFAMETVFADKINTSAPNYGKTAVALKSTDHWVAAPLAWRANISENNNDFALIWHAVSGINSNSSSHNKVTAPASCRLRYALAIADMLASKQKEIENMPLNSVIDGNADIIAQFSSLLLHSPSDDLLVFYIETNKLAQKDLISLLFRMLDSPILAKDKRLWYRLGSVVVSSSQQFDEDVIKEARRQWLGTGRNCWWPAFLEELNVPKSAKTLARKIHSILSQRL